MTNLATGQLEPYKERGFDRIRYAFEIGYAFLRIGLLTVQFFITDKAGDVRRWFAKRRKKR